MYIKKISGFIYDVENDFENAVISVLISNKGSSDDDAELRSWRESLPALADILRKLPESIKSNGEIVLEARYFVEEKRADAVLVGTNNGQKTIIIIENKRWSDLAQYEPRGENCVWDPYHCHMIDHP